VPSDLFVLMRVGVVEGLKVLRGSTSSEVGNVQVGTGPRPAVEPGDVCSLIPKLVADRVIRESFVVGDTGVR